MRDITQQEIGNAPEWAFWYVIAPNYSHRKTGDICYVDEQKKIGMWNFDDTLFDLGYKTEVYNSARPITPIKEFDITKCKFDGFSNVTVDEHFIIVEVVSSDDETTDVYIDKEFIIAAAKKFKLTAEDLK